MNQLELNVVESFRLAKGDIIHLQATLTELSQKQEELMERIDDLRVKEANLYQSLQVLRIKKSTAPKAKTRTVVKKVVVHAKKAKKLWVASKTGKSVHERNCPFAKNIKPKMKVVFKTKTRAFNKGYKACDCIKRV
jgi:hypothetical protein